VTHNNDTLLLRDETNCKHGLLCAAVSTRVYPKVSGLAAWSENCKWYSSLPLGAVVSLFCESGEFYCHNTLCCFSKSVYFLFISLSTQSGNFWIHPNPKFELKRGIFVIKENITESTTTDITATPKIRFPDKLPEVAGSV
jgi:hypothetical protein